MAYSIVLGHVTAAGTALGLLGVLSVSAGAGDPPISLDENPDYLSRLFEPGKLDFVYRHLTATEENRYNGFLWTPLFKGGGGILDPHDRQSIAYGGGFVRPLAAWPEAGDLIIGSHVVDFGDRRDYEIQGEYRLPMGLGFGGGFVNTANPATDVIFGKITYRDKLQSWNYILELQLQEFGEETSLGGYAAFYNEQFMLVGGTDGEQWRVTAGYLAPETANLFRPAVEILYVDNSIGELAGPRTWFGNLTLKYDGGFLSHPARLGRAMGPQGLEFGNPLGFLLPTWNRRLEVWELGGLAGARAERIEMPNNSVSERYEALIFPFQFAPADNRLDGFFIGGAYLKNPARDTFSCLGGYFGTLKPFKVFVGVEYELKPAETSVVVGLIHSF
ncbi:MAG: hypothetical protein ACR2OZ_20510 [Verrucomicrobiales bacterium]